MPRLRTLGPRESDSSVSRDLRSLLLAGYLCYTPIHRVSFTFDAFTLGPSHKRVLRQRIQEVSRVSLADPRTEGFGMSFLGALRRALGSRDVFQDVDILQDGEVQKEEETDIRRLRWRPYAIETSLGYWVPDAFIKDLRQTRDEIEAGIRERLRRLGEEMAGVAQDRLDEKLKEYVEEVQAFFGLKAPIEPREDHVGKFRTWVARRRRWLTDTGMLSYLASRLVIEPMPDLWAGGSATACSATKFENSFIEDLVFRLGVPGQNEVVKVMKRELEGNPATPGALRAALEHRLRRGFGPCNWTGEEPG